jgi:hypothetical protein
MRSEQRLILTGYHKRLRKSSIPSCSWQFLVGNVKGFGYHVSSLVAVANLNVDTLELVIWRTTSGNAVRMHYYTG